MLEGVRNLNEEDSDLSLLRVGQALQKKPKEAASAPRPKETPINKL